MPLALLLHIFFLFFFIFFSNSNIFFPTVACLAFRKRYLSGLANAHIILIQKKRAIHQNGSLIGCGKYSHIALIGTVIHISKYAAKDAAYLALF